MRFRKRTEEETRLGITPLIDIVFLLLIFFMLTSHFDVASGVRVRLPKAGQRVHDQDTSKATLVMDAEGNTFFKGRKVDRKELPEALRTLVEKNQVDQLILQADKNVTHGKVVHVMDLAKRAGIRSIIIAAQWDSEEVL
jgi:biopolymer transport protein ExbD